MSLENISMGEQNILKIYPKLLDILLFDHSTKKNLIWGTDNYKTHGLGYFETSHITHDLITGKHHNLIHPRSEKSKLEQKKRSKDMAEVFTPSWVCNKQNNLIDNSWFGEEDIFNKETSSFDWSETDKVIFNNEKTWKDYVQDIRLEITCGEAPYLVSRYNTVNGEKIKLSHRIGLLDRKFRVINENTKDDEEWLEWAIIAVQSVYGYDFQGDNVFLARQNVLLDFIENYEEKIQKLPSQEVIEKVADIISWNIWQMDGIKFVAPFSCHSEDTIQLSLFDEEIKPEQCRGCANGHVLDHNGTRCIIMDWQKNKKVKVLDLFNGGGLW